MKRPEARAADPSPPKRPSDQDRHQSQDDEGHEGRVEGEDDVGEEAEGGGVHRGIPRGDGVIPSLSAGVPGSKCRYNQSL
jgi:hypothetical protein